MDEEEWSEFLEWAEQFGEPESDDQECFFNPANSTAISIKR